MVYNPQSQNAANVESQIVKRRARCKRNAKERSVRQLLSSGELCLQCRREGFFLSLAFQFHKILGVLRPRVVDSTLSLLLTLPTTGPLVLVLLDGLGRVVVTNALVATVEKFIVRHVVLLDVLLDLIERPVGERVDLDKTGFVNLDHVEVTPLAALAPTATSKDSMDVKFPVGTLGGLNLGNPVVKLVVGLPKARSKLLGEFLFRVDALGLVDVDVVVGVPSADAVDEVKGFFEVVESVEEDQVDNLRSRDLQLRQHIDGHETSEAKGSGLEEMRKRGDTPSQNV